MTPLLVDGLGWIGAISILIAYHLVSTSRVSGISVGYQALNVVGSLLLILNTWYYGAFPSLGVNVVWVGIGLYALAIRTHSRHRKTSMSLDTSVPARFGHVNLIARDWRSLAAFYERVFGCEVVPPERDYAGPDLAAATGLAGARLRGVHLRLPGYGDAGPTLEIYEYTAPAYAEDVPPPVSAVHRPGFGHVAFAVDDVANARRVMLDAGGESVGKVVESVTQDGSRVTWCYCRDPEGNVVELQRWQ